MKREGHENVAFFVGTEVEHTPAYGMKTLFVVGVQDQLDVLKQAQANNVEHIYFGANQSFPSTEADYSVWDEWSAMIWRCLGQGFLCTLDMDAVHVERLLETDLIAHHNFVPMISVKLPHIQQLGYNATIKLDDRDFASTNPGVWCHSVHELRDRTKFTDWSKYTKDEVIK
jgi:hypothetical protein